jgi:hypothetical protein
MGEASIFMIFMMLLGGGSGNELLDLVPSDAYWKAKEVEFTAPNLMIELNSIKPDDTSKATAIRKLMAIRGLGELKSADAESTLKAQLESKEMFVAEYAQRAINAIEDKAPNKSSGVPPDQMKKDLYMLPEHCGAVGQAKLLPGKPLDWKKLLAKKPDENGGDNDPQQAELMTTQLTGSLIYVAEMTGNIRVDGVTIGVAEEIGPQQGFVCFLVRGQWDADAVKGALQTQFNQTQTVADMEFMTPGFGGAAAAIPSNELFTFMGGPSANALPMEDIAEAIKSGKGKLENATDLVKVIESTDIAQPYWASMIVTGTYAQAPMLAPLESLKLTGKPTAEGVKFEATGASKDADGTKSSVDQFTSLIEEAKTELSREADRTPQLQPLVDFFSSIELSADGVTAKGTGTMKRLAQ